MDLLLLIMFLGLVAVLSILLDRRWQRRAARRQPQPSAGQPAPLPVATDGLRLAGGDQRTTLIGQIRNGWHKRMGWHTQADTEQPKLREWLVAKLADQPTTQRWVAGLPDSEFNALRQQVHAFCAALQIDLAWLGEPPLAQDPALQATIQAVVLHYVQAQHQAIDAQAEIQAFKTYLALQQRPYSYENQPLLQQLYTQLVKAGLAAPARPEALLATEKIRVEHMLRAIQAAAEADRPAFYRVVNAVSNSPQPEEAAPLSPTPAHASQPVPAS